MDLLIFNRRNIVWSLGGPTWFLFKTKDVPSKGMIHVGIQGPFNFPPNYSQVNSNHPFPATIQCIPNISQLLYSHSNSVNKAIVAVALKCFLHLPRQGNYVRLCQGCFYRCGQAFSCQARPLRCGKGFVFLGKKEKDWWRMEIWMDLFTWWFFSGLCHEKPH